MALAALVACVALVACGRAPPPLAKTPPPPGTPPVIAYLRAQFHPHWEELLADRSPAAARTRAAAVAQAISGDSELYEKLTARESIDKVLARGLADAERAADAFADAPDVWKTLAVIRARVGDKRGAAVAACRASDLDLRSDVAALVCLESLLDAGDRAAATSRARKALVSLAPSSRDRVRAAIKAHDAGVADAVACADEAGSWDDLVACGDALARGGDRASARARYRAAFMIAPDRATQFTSILRIEEIGYECTEELMMLPPDRAAQYPLWKSMSGEPRRRAGVH